MAGRQEKELYIFGGGAAHRSRNLDQYAHIVLHRESPSQNKVKIETLEISD